MIIATPYLVFLGDAPDALAAKTGQGIVDWAAQRVVGQQRLRGCAADLGVPDLSASEAKRRGARTLVIGVANRGGVVPASWRAPLAQAIEAGLDIASGMHTRLADIPQVAAAAERFGQRLFDVRHPTEALPIATGKKRAGQRLLTVGTDCSSGKKYAALAIEKELRERGVAADYRATGQTGILIAGAGIAIDGVVSDFAAGAAEALSPDNDASHWDVVEGQGSLFHPSFAGVSLALLHGTQPDAVVVCHEPTRHAMRGVDTPVPTIRQVVDQTLALGRLTNPRIRCVGVALNTAALTGPAAREAVVEASRDLALPCCDPMRDGVSVLVDEMLA